MGGFSSCGLSLKGRYGPQSVALVQPGTGLVQSYPPDRRATTALCTQKIFFSSEIRKFQRGINWRLRAAWNSERLRAFIRRYIPVE